MNPKDDMNLSDGSLETMIKVLFPLDHEHNRTINLDEQLQPSTVDLRLGSVFWEFKLSVPPEHRRINPRTSKAIDYMRRVVVPAGEPYVLKPGAEHFVLAETMEKVAVPNDFVAFVDGRSSYGRHGLRIHSTAGLIDAGFTGVITLEIDLVNRYEMEIYPGDRICQIRFEQLDRAAYRPYGHPTRRSKYQNQAEATPSLAYRDGEEK